MGNAWIKFGCFLTGHNYSILKNCSEIAKKTIKRYTAALVVMCLLWGSIGYFFADRYLHSDAGTSLAVSFVFILIIVQVERQIILQTHKNTYLHVFRAVIAGMMALIGSLIIDQIIFKDDIELEKEQFINDKVEQIYPKRADIRQKQIDDLKLQLIDKDSQRTVLHKDILRNPVIIVTTVENNPLPRTESKTDSAGATNTTTIFINKLSTKKTQIPNPNIGLMAPLDSQINSIQRMVLSQGDSLANLRGSIEKSLRSKTGFLDELNIMFNLLSKSIPALVVYLIWFILLLGLEFFILMNKRHEQPTDYDAMIAHQMATHIKKLNILSGNSGVAKPGT